MAKRRPKAERLEYIRRTARELARSGEYDSWISIEFALRQRGYHEARSELDNRGIRAELDSYCKAARDAKEKGITFEQALREQPPIY